MSNIFEIGLIQAQVFILALARVSAVFVTAPLFGSRNVPAQLKAGLAFIVTFIIFPIIDRNLILPTDLVGYTLLIFQQILVGVIIGYATYIIFAGIQLAGQIIDLQMGFGIVNVMDPMSNVQVSIIGQFQFILAMLIFMAINGHHYLLQAVVDSFKIAPIGHVGITNETVSKLADIFYQMFLIAFRIAAPATVALLLTNVTLGFIARTIPQMNVFMVGLPLNIVVGLAAVMISMPVIINLFSTLLAGMWNDIYYLIKSMRV
ncbi:MAG: flagellar biosynthetic protein FliR [bacterium]